MPGKESDVTLAAIVASSEKEDDEVKQQQAAKATSAAQEGFELHLISYPLGCAMCLYWFTSDHVSSLPSQAEDGVRWQPASYKCFYTYWYEWYYFHVHDKNKEH